MSVYDQSTVFGAKLLSLVYVLVAFTLWIILQNNAVEGNPLSRYLMSLPMSERQRWTMQLGVLVRANNIGWLVFIVAIIETVRVGESTLAISYGLINIMALACLVLLAQMLWFYRSAVTFLLLFVVSVLYVASSLLHLSTIAVVVSSVFLVLLIFLLIYFPYLFERYLWLHVSVGDRSRSSQSIIFLDKPASIFGIMNITVKVLFDAYLYSTIIRCGICFTLSFLVIYILRHSGLSLSLEYFVFYLSAVTFVASETYSVLTVERKKIILLLASLPVKPGFWFVLDSVVIYSMVMVLSSPVFSYAVMKHMIGLIGVVTLGVYVLLLVCLLFWVRNTFEKQGAVVSAAVCIMGTLLGFLCVA